MVKRRPTIATTFFGLLIAAAVPGAAGAALMCTGIPHNGQLLASKGLLTDGGHTLEINNGAKGNAIIKVRDAATGSVFVSFYVQGSRTASISGIPDGDYKVQFATGDWLDAECRNFAELKWAEEFPGVQAFRTQTTATQIITSVLSYTLYEVSGGNISPETIPAEEFNRP